MNTIRRTFNRTFAAVCAIACAAFFLPTPAAKAADDFHPFTSTGLPPTFSVAAASTNTTLASSNIVFSVAAGQKAAVQMTHKLTGAGTSAVVWKFDVSNDKVRWKPLAYSVSVTAAGTNEVSNLENLDVGAALFLRLARCENPNASAVTNVVGNASVK